MTAAEPGPAAVAALDCGTNSTRLLVVDGRGEPLERLMAVTRLGEGVDADRRLRPDAVERTLGVLAGYRAVMDREGVARARLVATSAVRDAVNGSEFLDAASAVTGVRAELLSGTQEGTLAFEGAVGDLGAVPGYDVVVDIGGGSTELIVGRDRCEGVVSLDLGCVRVTERWFHHDPPVPEEVDAARAAIADGLDRAVGTIPVLGRLPARSRLVGLAGTVSTLAMLEAAMVSYDRDRVHHSILTREVVGRWCALLGAEPAAVRRGRPGMVAGREDVIAAGALVLREVMDRLGFPSLVVSEADILDGLVATLLE